MKPSTLMIIGAAAVVAAILYTKSRAAVTTPAAPRPALPAPAPAPAQSWQNAALGAAIGIGANAINGWIDGAMQSDDRTSMADMFAV